VLLLVASAVGACSSTTTTRANSTQSCVEVLATVVARERTGDTAGRINAELDWLSANCPTQYDIATDYFAARVSLTGPYATDCADLSSRVREEALELLRDDGLCDSVTGWVPSWEGGQPGGGIPWNHASEYAGTVQRVCGPLVSDGQSEDDVFLDLGLSYPDPGRFTIVVWDVGALEPIAYGSTLCTSGRIVLYNAVPQIQLRDPGKIEIYY